MTLTLDQIEELAQDRELVTPEIHQPNDFYGHARILKKYLGIHPFYSLKVAIEHGPTLSEYIWDADLNSPCPVFLCANDLSRGLYSKRCEPGKQAHAIGPLIHYLEDIQDRTPTKPLNSERTLLVFPNHSTHHNDIAFDVQNQILAIKERARGFDRVEVCIYWKDVLKGLHRAYAQKGFHCTTAGHMYDPDFLYRLKNIIERSSAVISFSCGTSSLYSILLGRPTWIVQDKNFSLSSDTSYFDVLQHQVSKSGKEMLVQLQKLFAEPSDELTHHQIEFVQKATGYANLKSKSELMQIIQQAEEAYCSRRHVRPSPIPTVASSNRVSDGDAPEIAIGPQPSEASLLELVDLMKQASQQLQTGDVSSAYATACKAKSTNIQMEGIESLLAICLLKMNKPQEAHLHVQNELSFFPDNRTAQKLLSKLNSDYGLQPGGMKPNQTSSMPHRSDERAKFDSNHINNGSVKSHSAGKQHLPEKKSMLNLGCGNHYHPDWINVDFNVSGPGVIPHDLSKGLPFSDNMFEVVYHSHLLEHFPRRYAPIFMQECYRVLKPEGIIRVVVPDLEQIVRCYLSLLEKSLEGDQTSQQEYEWIMLELFDQMVRNKSGGEMLAYWRQNPMPAEDFVIRRMGSEVKNAIAKIRSDRYRESAVEDHTEANPVQVGRFRASGEIHQWMYDRYSLSEILNGTGFTAIKACRADESVIPRFNTYYLDILENGSVRKPDSLFMEAVKPISR